MILLLCLVNKHSCVTPIKPTSDHTVAVYLFKDRNKPEETHKMTYVELFPEARLALLPRPLLGVLGRLVQEPDSGVDVCCVHPGGVVRLERGSKGRTSLMKDYI